MRVKMIYDGIRELTLLTLAPPNAGLEGLLAGMGDFSKTTDSPNCEPVEDSGLGIERLYVPTAPGTFSRSMLTSGQFGLFAIIQGAAVGRKSLVTHRTWQTEQGDIPHTTRELPLEEAYAELNAFKELEARGFNVPRVHGELQVIQNDGGDYGFYTIDKIPGDCFEGLLAHIDQSNAKHMRLKYILFQAVMDDMIRMKGILTPTAKTRETNYHKKLPETAARLVQHYRLNTNNIDAVLASARRLGSIWDNEATTTFVDRNPTNIVFDYLNVLRELAKYIELPREMQGYIDGKIMSNFGNARRYILGVLESNETLITELLIRNLYHIDLDTITKKTAMVDDIV